MNDKSTYRYSTSLEAFQSLLKEMDEANGQQQIVPTLDHVLQYTHTLSSRLSGILNNLVRISAGGERAIQERMPQAIADSTDSITTLKELMLILHRLRFAAARNTAALH